MLPGIDPDRRGPAAGRPARSRQSRYGAYDYSIHHHSGLPSCDPEMQNVRRMEETTMIRGVKFVSIPVTDQDRALKFYTETLGFRLVTDQPFSPEQRWIEL